MTKITHKPKNDQNTPKTKIKKTKISLKTHKMTKIPLKTQKNDQNTLET